MHMAQPGKPVPKLVQKAAQGNRKAFRELFDRYFQAVYNYSLTLTGDPAQAEDITQETFIRAHKNLHRLGPPWNFHAWVFRLARNYFIDQFRKDRDLYPLEEDVQVISDRPGPEREKITRDTADSVHSTLSKLSVRQREILVLRELQGFSYAEIGEILELSSSNVKVSLHRARAAFAETFGNQLLLEDPSGDCVDVVELLHAYHDQEELLDRESYVKEHLKTCQECQERRDALIAQSVAFGAFIPVIPPQGLAQSILEKTAGNGTGPGDQKSAKLKKSLIAGGGAIILSGMAFVVYSMFNNPNSILPNFPGLAEPTASPVVLAPPVPTETPIELPPPLPPPPTPTATQISRCDLFEEIEFSLVVMDLIDGTFNIPIYVKMEGGVLGGAKEEGSRETLWPYSALLGEIPSYRCDLQGFDDRLYCFFNLPPEMPGTQQTYQLLLEDCEEAIFSQVVLLDVCHPLLAAEPCKLKGGEYKKISDTISLCFCP
jgi:RNA polymerase sigma-70 factor (ECF subfamily)